MSKPIPKPAKPPQNQYSKPKFQNHFWFWCMPSAFAVNIISATVLIWKKTRQEQSIHPNKDFKKILRQQIQKHRHILTSPLILTILGIPRLIIIFISKCMQSSNDSWLFLIGYFISFLPLMLTFVIYILSSKYYKTEFKNTIRQYRTQIRRPFYSK